jgi:hypothetical protein
MMKRMTLKGLFATLVMLIMAGSMIGCGGSAPSSNTSSIPLNELAQGGAQSQSQTAEDPANDPALAPRPGMPDYVGKYTLVRMQTVKGESLDEADLDIVYSSTGGAAKNFVDIIDTENLYLAMGGNTSMAAYTKNGNNITAKDSMGNSLKLLLNGDEISIEFSDELLGKPGEGYTVYFKKVTVPAG